MYNTVVEGHQICTIKDLRRSSSELFIKGHYNQYRKTPVVKFVSRKIPSVFLLSFLSELGAIEFPRYYYIIYHYFYVFLVVCLVVVIKVRPIRIFVCVFQVKKKIFL